MEVYENVGGDAEPKAKGLVASYRRFLSEVDFKLREAPFDKNVFIPHKLIIFNDMLLICLPKLNPPAGRSSRKKASETPSKLTVVHALNLLQCSVKPISAPNKDGEFGIVLTHVARMHVEDDAGKDKLVTKIDKMEMWLGKDDSEQMDVFEQINHIIETLEETEDERKHAENGLKKKRSWAARKTMSRSRSMRPRTNTSDDASVVDSIGGLSLADLESRYNFEVAENVAESAQFEVMFGEGPMGFSLGSGPGVGVIIGRLAPGSFAEVGGVCIGDRITRVAKQDIALGMKWEDCVELIKSEPRPLEINFERNATNQPEPTPEPATDAPKADKKRGWAARRAQRAISSGGGKGGVYSCVYTSY